MLCFFNFLHSSQKSGEMEQTLDGAAVNRRSKSFSSTTDIDRTTSSGSDITSTSSSTTTSNFLTPNSASNLTDPCWRAIKSVSGASISLSDLTFLRRLGSGDIAAVYLVKLENSPETSAVFAAKVTNRKEIEKRERERRARVEREILEVLDHPFLPTLYATIDSPEWSCLLTEFCAGGDLHVVRQLQPAKRFSESAVRFYASEVIAALEYIHMLGIVYRDLKPENVLLRSDGHIMLTDFDLSLKCDACVSATVVSSAAAAPDASPQHNNDDCCNNIPASSCIAPAVSCFHLRRRRKKKEKQKEKENRDALPEVVAEPVEARSMSFVGTHEYLAPEIVSGEGHGSAVDWWTLGIFIFEMLYGTTPFKGAEHEETLGNIVVRAVEFPKEPSVSTATKDLISKLLVKDPARRLGATMGAAAVKRHPFFHGLNWALLRRKSPPFVPPLVNLEELSKERCTDIPVEFY